MATLSGIYQWISDNFPYYKTAGNGWKASLLLLLKTPLLMNSSSREFIIQPMSLCLQIIKLYVFPHL